MNLGEQRALHAHGIVEARRHLLRGVHVVDDIDAADQRHPGVEDRNLAVQPAQTLAAQRPRRDIGTVLENAHAGELQKRQRQAFPAAAPASP